MPRFPTLIGLFGLVAILSGCGSPPGKLYALPLADARSRVFAAEVPMFVFGNAGGMMLDAQPVAEPDKISWPITAERGELFRYVATITPVDATHTRVAVALVPAPAGDVGKTVAEGLKANADIARLYRDAMAESVDARLENREPTLAAITPAMTLVTIGHLDDINATFDREIDRHGKQVKSNLERAYAAEGVEY